MRQAARDAAQDIDSRIAAPFRDVTGQDDVAIQDATDHVSDRLFHIGSGHEYGIDRRDVALSVGAWPGPFCQLGDDADG